MCETGPGREVLLTTVSFSDVLDESAAMHTGKLSVSRLLLIGSSVTHSEEASRDDFTACLLFLGLFSNTRGSETRPDVTAGGKLCKSAKKKE